MCFSADPYEYYRQYRGWDDLLHQYPVEVYHEDFVQCYNALCYQLGREDFIKIGDVYRLHHNIATWIFTVIDKSTVNALLAANRLPRRLYLADELERISDEQVKILDMAPFPVFQEFVQEYWGDSPLTLWGSRSEVERAFKFIQLYGRTQTVWIKEAARRASLNDPDQKHWLFPDADRLINRTPEEIEDNASLNEFLGQDFGRDVQYNPTRHNTPNPLPSCIAPEAHDVVAPAPHLVTARAHHAHVLTPEDFFNEELDEDDDSSLSSYRSESPSIEQPAAREDTLQVILHPLWSQHAIQNNLSSVVPYDPRRAIFTKEYSEE